MIRSGKLITPHVAQFDRDLCRSKIIQCDETPLQVLKGPDRPASSHSYMWVR
ncbi:IS66 family transposase [Zhongshania sp.]|uniref:IS66 family transposase n=1 Tax=Zhongshania sp. TaxID=1971902 RepID=UPI002A83AD3D|nr:transposase [Zhongshania sp.]